MEATAVVPEGRISPEDAVRCKDIYALIDLRLEYVGLVDGLPGGTAQEDCRLRSRPGNVDWRSACTRRT